MKGLRRHPLRVTGRFIWFAGVVIVSLSGYFFRFAFRKKKSTPVARARWLQRNSRRVLKIFKLEPQVAGPVPSRGLLVSNHLSYLDILVISSVTPAVFVAKLEVKSWPVIGWLASLGGTVYVDRQRRTQVGEVNDEIQAALDSGALVVLFPEGTSSDGQGVLPFKSALLEPAARPRVAKLPLAISFIQYAMDDGDPAQDVCYWGDHTFFPHMLNLLSRRTVRAAVRFAAFPPTGADRKELAQQLRAEILKLKDDCRP